MAEDDDLLDLSQLVVPHLEGEAEQFYQQPKKSLRDPIGHEREVDELGLPTGRLRFFLKETGETLAWGLSNTRFTTGSRPFELQGFPGLTGRITHLKRFLWERQG